MSNRRQGALLALALLESALVAAPNDTEAVALGNEYLWGRDILVAPIVEKAVKSRRVYLPAGTWLDWWTSEKLQGKKWIERPVDLATIPLYVRAGAIIPLDPLRQYTAQPITNPTTLRIFPGADGAFSLYDDDGQSLGYRDGSDAATVWIRFRWDDAARRLTVAPDPRMKRWPGGVRQFAAEMAGQEGSLKGISFKGEPVEVSF